MRLVMPNIKNFFKELSKTDIFCLILTLITVILLISSENFNDEIVNWLCLFWIVGIQLFMINSCQKSRRLLKNN